MDKKYNWLRILKHQVFWMILSSLFLVGFAVKWLENQYVIQKNLAIKDIQSDIKKVSDQLADSLVNTFVRNNLIQKQFSPHIKDTDSVTLIPPGFDPSMKQEIVAPSAEEWINLKRDIVIKKQVPIDPRHINELMKGDTSWKKISGQLMDSIFGKIAKGDLSGGKLLFRLGPGKETIYPIDKADSAAIAENFDAFMKNKGVAPSMERSANTKKNQVVKKVTPMDPTTVPDSFWQKKDLGDFPLSSFSISDPSDFGNALSKSMITLFLQLNNQTKREDIFTLTGMAFDTTLCRKLMKKIRGPEKEQYQLYFRKNKADHTKIAGVYYTKSPLLNASFGLKPLHFQQHIVAKILSDVLVMVFLILVTITAFTFSYRNYSKQVQLNQIRKSFVDNISHELKTPISTVKVAIEALQHFERKSDPKLMNEYLGLMTMEIDRLDNLVHQVLVSSSLERENNYIHMEPTDVTKLIQEVIVEFQHRIETAQANIRIDLPKEPVLLNSDKLHIHGVFSNLLDNSLKYAGDQPEITISLEVKNNQVMLLFNDNGPGIPYQYATKIFDKFFRIPTGNLHQIKGYGLGLNYCFEIMKQHRGTIKLKNKKESGCLFELVFPYTPLHEK